MLFQNYSQLGKGQCNLFLHISNKISPYVDITQWKALVLQKISKESNHKWREKYKIGGFIKLRSGFDQQSLWKKHLRLHWKTRTKRAKTKTHSLFNLEVSVFELFIKEREKLRFLSSLTNNIINFFKCFHLPRLWSNNISSAPQFIWFDDHYP